jgi:hypothetical protein
MDFGSDITDNKKIVSVSKTYDNHIRRIRRCFTSTYYITSITSSASSGNYYQLQDGGRPQAIVYVGTTQIQIVNTPVYISAPPDTVTGVILGGSGSSVFDLTVNSCPA